MHAPLTGLHNRRSLDDGFQRELLRAARKRSSVGVLRLDLDHFKEFNDAQGHAAGNALLRAVARQLRGDIRAEDLEPPDDHLSPMSCSPQSAQYLF
ncbi:MAG: GGDEF domain-containing protein [Deltaproteobacteria bacterium]|nr:GGDEF domain-containing protein [Deltaproteobacteria bacterium]MBW2537190.1 GGDEF domain-containing protein [Deltaproteobacteria bacterium]